MSKFWIREGDAAPPITGVIIDAEGNAVNLTDATDVILELRDYDGTVFDTYAGTFDSPRTDGAVRYAWQSVDTEDNAGEYMGHWIVTWTGGATQSFPTEGWIEIIIASATGYVGIYSPADLLESRQRAGEIGDTTYTDSDIAVLLATRSGDTAAVASDIWALKASDAANLVDMTEGGGSRKFSTLYKQCLEMSKFWAERSPVLLAESRAPENRRGARTRGIERV